MTQNIKFEEGIFDVAIIGDGPAGLTAALTLVKQKLNVAIFGKKSSYSDEQKPVSGEIGAHPLGIHSRDYRKYCLSLIFGDQDERQKVRYLPAAEDLVKMKNGEFAIRDEAPDEAPGKWWQAKKVILATGVTEDPPQISGYGPLMMRKKM